MERAALEDRDHHSSPGEAALCFKGLNEQQRRAVEATEGHVLVLAGAGSGKTRVLIERMAHLLVSGKAKPEQILALTFTNKAAREMRERLRSRLRSLQKSGFSSASNSACNRAVDLDPKKVVIETFHSFSLALLRQIGPAFGLDRRFTLYSEYDMRRLYQRLVREELGIEGELPSFQGALTLVDQARAARLSYEEIVGNGEEKSAEAEELFGGQEAWTRNFCAQLLERMRSALQVYRALDFQGLIEKLLEIALWKPSAESLSSKDSKEIALEERKIAAQRELLSRFRYIMIDEYQDTDPMQDALARALAQDHGNLCVVGDDDQSIYAWRGAKVKNILEFPALHTIKLEQNYRSSGTILEGANAVIKENRQRYHKELWSRKEKGEPIHIWHAPDELQEAKSIVNRLVALAGQGVSFGEMAILYRSNKLKNLLEAELLRASYRDWRSGELRRGISYRVYGGQSLYESKEVLDLQNYLKMLLNPRDDLSWLAVVNHPRRGIGDRALSALAASAKEGGEGRLSLELEAQISEKREREQDLFGCDALSVPKRGEGLSSALARFGHWCLEARGRLHQGGEGASEFLTWILESIDYDRSIEQEFKSDKMRQFKRANLKEYLEQAEQFEHEHSSLPLRERLALFLSQTSLDRVKMQAQGEQDQRTLSLLTFHSSKGLEYPYVFIMGLEDDLVPHTRSVVDEAGGFGGGIEEERRLLYVALTRAQKRLFLSMAKERGKKQKKPSPFLASLPKEVLKVVDYRWDHLT